MTGYFYFFFKDAQVIFNEFVHITQSYCQNLAQTITREGDYGLDILFFDSISEKFIKGHDEIYRIIITDNENNVIFSTDEKNLIYQKFELKNVTNINPNLVSYKDNKEIKVSH